MQLANQSLMRRWKPINTHKTQPNLFTILHSSLCKGGKHSPFSGKRAFCVPTSCEFASARLWKARLAYRLPHQQLEITNGGGTISSWTFKWKTKPQNHHDLPQNSTRDVFFSAVLLMGNRTRQYSQHKKMPTWKKERNASCAGLERDYCVFHLQFAFAYVHLRRCPIMHLSRWHGPLSTSALT